MKRGIILGGFVILFLSTVATLQILNASSSYAVSASEFIPGRIIDDEIFYDKDGMSSVAEIQQFLNAHTPSCDTWGTGPSGYKGMTNAQYAQQVKGWPGPPYVCLNNYYENPNNGATSFENGGGAFSGGISAAEIIYNSAQQYRINPKVLLVMLRKESLNLFSDSWPMKSQYKYSMGYACPDSGPGYSANCQESKAGLYKQISYAAWQLRYYYDHMGSYNYAPGRWNTIRYSTDPTCGTKDVYIENNATASLYIYTPYTPNNGALNAYPGTSSCGAYGNRNFWFFWQEWFGSPLGLDSFVSITEGISLSPRPTTMYNGDSVKVGFTVRNRSTTKEINIGNISVCARRISDGKNFDLPWKNNVIIQPGQNWLFSEMFIAPSADSYRFWICNYRDSTSWSDTFPQSATSSIARELIQQVRNAPTLTTSINSGQGEVVAGKPFTIQFSIKNNDNAAMSLGSAIAAVRSADYRGYDFPIDQNITIQPGATYTYAKAGILPTPGVYRGFVSILRPDFGWNENIGLANQNVSRELIITVQPNPRMISSLTTSTSQTVQGRNINVQFSYRNDSAETVKLGSVLAVALGPDGVKENFPFMENITIQPGQTYVYSQAKPLLKTGKYKIFASILQPNGQWNEEYPALQGVTRQTTVEVTANPRLSASITTESSEIVAGKPFNLKFAISNEGNIPMRVGKPIAAVRGPNNSNNDFPLDEDITILPGQTYIYNKTTTITKPGNYRAFVSILGPGNIWNEQYPTDSNVNRIFEFAVQSNPRMSSSLVLNKTIASRGESIGVTFQYKNDSHVAIKLGSVVAVAVAPDGIKEYFPFPQNITIAAGETYTYEGQAGLTKVGQYRVFASVQLPNGAWDEQFPIVNSGILRQSTITIY